MGRLPPPPLLLTPAEEAEHLDSIEGRTSVVAGRGRVGCGVGKEGLENTNVPLFCVRGSPSRHPARPAASASSSSASRIAATTALSLSAVSTRGCSRTKSGGCGTRRGRREAAAGEVAAGPPAIDDTLEEVKEEAAEGNMGGCGSGEKSVCAAAEERAPTTPIGSWGPGAMAVGGQSESIGSLFWW